MNTDLKKIDPWNQPPTISRFVISSHGSQNILMLISLFRRWHVASE